MQAVQQRAATLSLCLAVVVLSAAPQARAQCPTADSPYVRFSGSLTEMEHDVSGTLTILDDCTAEVRDFTYDGNAPAAYWWGAPSTDNSDIRQNGRRIADMLVDQAYEGETVTFTLSPGLSWSDFPVITLWCEDFYADFGHVEIQPATVATPAAPAAPATPAAPAAPAPAVDEAPPPADRGLGLANCIELLPGFFNLHYEVEEGMLTLALEGRAGGDNRWLGFGFSQPNATDVLMPGADAVVVGMVAGQCFALDYQLQSRSQCSYTERQGVCPDAALSGDPATNQVQLLSCEKVGDVLAVAVSRPLSASDALDLDWPLDGGGRFPVWAMGPVSEASNATHPVVLYHRLLLPDAASEDTIHAPLGQNYRISLGQPSPLASSGCKPLLAAARGAQHAGAPTGAPVAAPGQVATLQGVTEFEVVTGDNLNYPNPPGWGISYHINGEESPVLSVKRGTAYTFKVMAGEIHPLYLTSSITGGGSFSNFAEETVYAGGEDAHGTPEAPFLLEWTPDADTPDLLYYQCTVHMKLGWQIVVEDA